MKKKKKNLKVLANLRPQYEDGTTNNSFRAFFTFLTSKVYIALA